MPLPPALIARLAKRGIVDETLIRQEKKAKSDAEEEVIAENYDSNIKTSRSVSNSLNLTGTQNQDEITSLQVEKQFKGHSGCPNKWNIYHECSASCILLWGKGHVKPDPKYLRKQSRLLAKYPLSSNWKEVFDPGSGRHYYWEMTSDMVSWLPPGHPKAVISESASTIREERHLAATDHDVSDHDSDSQDEEEEDAPDQSIRDEREPRKGERDRQKLKSNNLDPMDPAAYSDAPRGRWSDGLERGNEAKTGADVTAAGPLYQMRPYPSPGAVLRANALSSKLNH